MKALRPKSLATCIALVFALLLLLPLTRARSETEQFLNRFQGSWQGEGKAFQMTARLQMKWELVLGDKFLRLTLRNTMRGTNGQTQVFEGHAYYRSSGESRYEGKWFDSRGEAFPIMAQAEGDALVSSWGTPEQEQGKSIYRIIDSNKMEVVDSVRQKDGTWKEFGRFVISRE